MQPAALSDSMQLPSFTKVAFTLSTEGMNYIANMQKKIIANKYVIW